MRESCHFSPDVPRPRELAAAIHAALGLAQDWRGYTWRGYPKAQMETQIRVQTLAQLRQALALTPNSAMVNYY